MRMLFLGNKKRQLHMQKQAHLQGQWNTPNTSDCFDPKRACALAPPADEKQTTIIDTDTKYAGGSLTIEAAVVLPVFLIVLISLLYVARIFLVQLTLIGPLHETGRRLARDLYIYDVLEGEDAEDENEETSASLAGKLLVGTLSQAAAKSIFVGLVGEEWLENSGIEDGVSGLSFAWSSLPDEDGMIDLIVRYQMQIPFRLLQTPSFTTVLRCRVHGWIGNKDSAETDGDASQTVYVAENGTVYHLYLTCSHLKLSIREVPYLSVASLRNDGGAKYYPCEICGALETAMVYITDSGNRYHSRISCSGLKRGIREVSVEDVGDLPLCSRCAAGG